MNYRNLTLSAKIRSNLPQIEDITDRLPKHSSKAWPKRDFSKLAQLVVHHTASEAPLINQAKYHISAHNWPGLAYTFVISQGKIYQTNSLDARTSHALGVNDTSIGVCIHGDLSKRAMTPFEREALSAVLYTLKELFPHVVVKGHNEASWEAAKHRTSCPCTDMNKIRSDLETMEHEIAYNESAQKKEEVAYRMANHILYLQRMSKGLKPDDSAASEGERKWALSQLLKLEPEFRRLGFLK